jgi:signal transduction histidine kinase/CheY-like chemotaxis protein
MTTTHSPRWFLSTAPASAGERVVAILMIAIAFLAFVATIPFVRVPLARVPAFIPAYQAALFFVDLITAVLLLGQFMWLRSRALLALAAGYLFDAAMIVPHTLSFPGVFAPTGLLASGPQTTAWLYVFWHGGFPLFVLLYAYLRRSTEPIRQVHFALAVAATIAAVAALAAAFTILATAGHDLLPVVMDGSDYSMLVTKGISPLVWFLTLAALVAVWRGATTVLDLWVLVVMTVWLLDIALAAVFGSSRFDLGFYAGRLYGLIAASVVLIALLVEMVRLYGRLADAIAVAEEKNNQLVASREALAAAHRMEALGQLTGSIAHDFNNLLTVISGNLELIQRDRDDPSRVQRLAERAMTAVKRGARLTRHLLTFGGRQTLRPTTVDVSRLVQDFEPMLHRAAESTELLTGLSQSVHPIHVDPTQFETALINLVGNARDATAGHGRIIVETRNVTHDALQLGSSQEVVPGDYVTVTVRDNGPGMPPDVAARAFEPFFTTKATGKASGLGLSQVYGFVRSAGGHLRLETTPGRGTSVHMYFPKTDKVAQHDAIARAAASLTAPHNETILVVEDDADVREVTCAAVTDLGYGVREATNADDALALLRSDAEVDVLFSDIVMPGGMTGLELAAEARRIRPNLKILLTSGHAGALMAPEIDGHSFDILEKPYPHHDLATKLRAVIGAG